MIPTFLTEGAPAPLDVVPALVVADPLGGKLPIRFRGFASGDTVALGLGEA